jgi:hypothetical protein
MCLESRQQRSAVTRCWRGRSKCCRAPHGRAIAPDGSKRRVGVGPSCFIGGGYVCAVKLHGFHGSGPGSSCTLAQFKAKSHRHLSRTASHVDSVTPANATNLRRSCPRFVDKAKLARPYRCVLTCVRDRIGDRVAYCIFCIFGCIALKAASLEYECDGASDFLHSSLLYHGANHKTGSSDSKIPSIPARAKACDTLVTIAAPIGVASHGTSGTTMLSDSSMSW